MIRRFPFFYGWLMVAAAGLTMTLVYAMRYSFSVFYPVMLDEFGWSQAATSLAFSINLLVYGFSAPLTGTLADRLGTRNLIPIGAAVMLLASFGLSRVEAIWQLYLFLGLMAFGTASSGWPVHALILSNWFVRRRGLAAGLITAGWGLSYLSAPVTEFLINNMGWRNTYLTLGLGVSLIVGAVGYGFQRRRPQDYGLYPDGIALESTSELASGGSVSQSQARLDLAPANPSLTLSTAVKTAQFWMILAMNFFQGIAFNMLGLHLVRFFQVTGFGRAFGATVLATLGVVSGAGNLAAFLSDRIGRERAYTLAATGSIGGVLLLFVMKDPSLVWLAFLFAVLMGFSQGLGSTSGGAAIADLFQGPAFGSINGLTVIGFGLGGLVGPWFGGLTIDITNSYDIAFTVVILCMAGACASLWLAAPRKVRPIGQKLPAQARNKR